MNNKKSNIVISSNVPEKLENIVLKYYNKYNNSSKLKTTKIRTKKIDSNTIVNLLKDEKCNTSKLTALVKYNYWEDYSNLKIVGMYNGIGKEIEFSRFNNQIPGYLMNKENFEFRRDNFYLLLKNRIDL